jgi:hypothetical protein
MDEPGQRRMRVIPDGIDELLQRRNSLADVRDELSRDRIVWIVAIDQPRDFRSNRDAVARGDVSEIRGAVFCEEPRSNKVVE